MGLPLLARWDTWEVFGDKVARISAVKMMPASQPIRSTDGHQFSNRDSKAEKLLRRHSVRWVVGIAVLLKFLTRD